MSDVVRGQWNPGEVDPVILNTAMRDGRGVTIREEMEPGSAGKAVCVARAKTVAGYDYKGIPASGDKVTRWRLSRRRPKRRTWMSCAASGTMSGSTNWRARRSWPTTTKQTARPPRSQNSPSASTAAARCDSQARRSKDGIALDATTREPDAHNVMFRRYVTVLSKCSIE